MQNIESDAEISIISSSDDLADLLQHQHPVEFSNDVEKSSPRKESPKQNEHRSDHEEHTMQTNVSNQLQRRNRVRCG
eukprot:CAMPEP_0194416844 /NCGR_PEP_ID=MMETSP0176-20130528/15817_1 /TAXON_ID=216777 /ORGANISM="Proboscia alata, Strain PI-D3" /LENGTH=76 /DNA_ID=CAMNT_0039222367 /DNA_START=1 /DNA_END=228 /DNA_ORIENTATION=+